jgi:hypothetical protein
VDRHPARSRELAVDLADEPLDRDLLVLVAGISSRLGTTIWINVTPPRRSSCFCRSVRNDSNFSGMPLV